MSREKNNEKEQVLFFSSWYLKTGLNKIPAKAVTLNPLHYKRISPISSKYPIKGTMIPTSVT